MKPGEILFGKFKVQQHVGGGTFGEVYRVKEIGTDAVLAVKLLHGKPDDTDLAEAALLRQLEHANIVKFYGYDTDAEHLGFVMEYMDGGSLADLCELEGSLSPEKATSLMIQVCKGMAFAHAKNVIHRDLKPENILINTDGKVKVADFGVAKALAGTQAASTSIGTPYYMAPEQFEDRYDVRVDVYALGCIFFHLLKGEPPFTGSQGNVMRGHMLEAPKIPAHWPQAVSGLLEACLAKEPDQRPANAGQLLEQIELLAKLEEDPDATRMVKRSATMFSKKKAPSADSAEAVKQPKAGGSAGRSSDEQAQALANKAEAFMDQGDFSRARKYLELAKEADSDFVAYAERTDRLEKQEKAWPHKQEAEERIDAGVYCNAKMPSGKAHLEDCGVRSQRLKRAKIIGFLGTVSVCLVWVVAIHFFNPKSPESHPLGALGYSMAYFSRLLLGVVAHVGPIFFAGFVAILFWSRSRVWGGLAIGSAFLLVACMCGYIRGDRGPGLYTDRGGAVGYMVYRADAWVTGNNSTPELFWLAIAYLIVLVVSTFLCFRPRRKYGQGIKSS